MRDGESTPKPLIDLRGRPLFWWALRSITQQVDIAQAIAVVLQEHVDHFSIDRQLLDVYSGFEIVVIPNVTSGSLETALIGMDELSNSLPVIFNDCDHAFDAPDLATRMAQLRAGEADGCLCTFASTNPAYSYAEFDGNGNLRRTVEKQVISNAAVAGAYGFRNAETARSAAGKYIDNCPYDELFVSGLYNVMLNEGMKVGELRLNSHLSFGTPAELQSARASAVFDDWPSKLA